MYDFVVIGSGAAGGVLAHQLHSKGARVLLIEAGKFYRKDTFPKTEKDYSAQLFWGGGIEFDTTARTAFLRGKCVGGTSIVNQSLLNRFDALAFQDWKSQSGVDFFTEEGMKPWYDAVESNLVAHTFAKEEMNNNGKIFTRGCEKLGYGWEFLRRGQSDCVTEKGNDCLGCLGGCHRDSKQSTLVAFIQKAEKEGLEILPEFIVEKVEDQGGKVRITGRKGSEIRVIESGKVILAGGSFGSTGIMLKSGFGSSLPALGKGFTCHPQYMLLGVFEEEVNSHKGAFQTVASKDPSFRKAGFKLENVYAPPISIGMLFNYFGPRQQELMMKYRYSACFEVAVRDEPNGFIALDKKGKLAVTKNLTAQDLSRRDAGIEAVTNIFQAAGVKEVLKSPYFFGLHLMGGCAIGTDAGKSVVNPDFQVHKSKNIYISDSSIFPSAPGINPSLSIMTFSYKLAHALTQS